MGIMNDVRLALRLVRVRPRFVVSVVGISAVGICGAALVVSFALQINSAPLPYRDLNEIVMVLETTSNQCPGCADAVAYDRFVTWQAADLRGISALAGVISGKSVISTNGQRVPVSVAHVTDDFGSAIGVGAALGSLASMREVPSAVAISYDAWRSLFRGDRAVIGKSVALGDQVATVGAVMPVGFDFPRGTRIWMRFDPALVGASRAFPTFMGIGRVRRGSSQQAVAAELRGITAPSAVGIPVDEQRGVWVRSLEPELRATTTTSLHSLVASVVLIFLVACTSAATLVIARTVDRRQEFALRQALGAVPREIRRSLILEIAVLVGSAGIVGIVVASSVAPLLATVLETQLMLKLWFDVQLPLIGLGLALTATAIAFSVALTLPTV